MKSQGRALWLGEAPNTVRARFPERRDCRLESPGWGPRQGRALVQQVEGFPSLGGFELVFGEDGVELAGECVAVENRRGCGREGNDPLDISPRENHRGEQILRRRKRDAARRNPTPSESGKLKSKRS
jgi:hypothetical protein